MGLFKNGVGRPSNETIKKRRIFYVALVAILGLTVAFAAMSTTLTINGKANVKSSKWDVHFDNLELIEEKGRGVGNKVGNETDDAKIEETGIEINNLEGELYQPLDSVKYQVDVVNEGDIDALVTINENIVNEHPEIVEVKALYTDGKAITEERSLKADESLTLTVEISYKDIDDPDLLLQEEKLVTLSYSLLASQNVNLTKESGNDDVVTELNTGDTLPSGFFVLDEENFNLYSNEEDFESIKNFLEIPEEAFSQVNVLGNTVPELTKFSFIIDLNNRLFYFLKFNNGIYEGFCLRINGQITNLKLSFALDSINGKNLVSLEDSFSGDDEIVDFSGYDIPDTVKNISYMLSNCSNLESAPSIPVSVTRAEKAFHNCPKLEEVIYEGSLEQFKQIDWYDEIGDNGLVVHCTDGDYTVVRQE